MVLDQSIKKTLEMVEKPSTAAAKFVIDKFAGDNHPDYVSAIVEGRSEALKEMARNDQAATAHVYESLRQKAEARSFLNFSNVVTKFVQKIKSNPKEKIKDDNDFFPGLLEHSKAVSNEVVQDLIANILASEYNSPDTYSMTTLATLKSLGKKELEKFAFFASFYVRNAGFFKDFFSIQGDVLGLRVKLGINYKDFLELQNIGLIQSGSYTQTIDLKKEQIFNLENCGTTITFKVNRDFKNWNFPECYEMTGAGIEIVKHLQVDKSDDFQVWLKDFLRKKGFEYPVET